MGNFSDAFCALAFQQLLIQYEKTIRPIMRIICVFEYDKIRV